MGYIFENEEDPQWKRKAKVKTKIVEVTYYCMDL